MNTKRALKGALIVIGVLSLFYIGVGLTHPERTKARAQRIGTVNAAPRAVMSSSLSNTTAPASTLPSTGR